MAKADKPKLPVQLYNANPEQAAAIDGLGARQAAYDKAKKLVKEFDEDKKALVTELSATMPPATTRRVKGAKFELVIDPTEQRVVTDVLKLADLLGPETFVKLISVRLGDIDDYLPKNLHDQVLKTEAGSPRGKVKKVE